MCECCGIDCNPFDDEPDGRTEMDAAKDACCDGNCADICHPPINNCCCGWFSLRSGTGVMMSTDAAWTGTVSAFQMKSAIQDKFDIGSMGALGLMFVPLLVIFFTCGKGLFGVVKNKGEHVQWYVYALYAWQAISLLIPFIQGGSACMPSLMGWVASLGFCWWKAGVSNAFMKKVKDGPGGYNAQLDRELLEQGGGPPDEE
eukprot:GEMP01058369.1.p2 GENE.GEMP01058369.1~~GEMP01058369.1.p2  ORF type:complete len:210 (+),score=51.57 GEMP01058369.1:30-632(+)